MLNHRPILLLIHPWNPRHISDGLPVSAGYSVPNGSPTQPNHYPTDLPSSHVSSVPYSTPLDISQWTTPPCQHSIFETHTRAASQARALYACSKDILPSDHHIFSLPLEILLTKSTQFIQLFVAHNKPIVKQSIRLQRNLTRRQHHDIATYFHANTQVTHSK